METIFADNTSILFIIALFYTISSGVNLTIRLRVALVYAFTLASTLFGPISPIPALWGSLIIVFLMLEVFNPDEKLVSLFSIPYKLVDFLYRMVCEYYGWIYLICYISIYIMQYNDISKIIYQVFGSFALLVLLLLLSKARYSTKQVAEMIEQLTCNCSINDYPLFERRRNKYEILASMEDREFFHRKESQHCVAADHLVIKAFSNENWKTITYIPKVFCRGYSTIEMQLIRTVGIKFGSYSCCLRRKLFEVLFSTMVFNSYIRQYSELSEARANARLWIIQSYIENVQVKFGKHIYQSDSEGGTFKKVFKKSLDEATDEEFFVWCLGLPHYKYGVGSKAVNSHEEIVKSFGLRRNQIDEAIKIAMAS